MSFCMFEAVKSVIRLDADLIPFSTSFSGFTCLNTLPDSSSVYVIVWPNTGPLSSAALYLKDMWHLKRTVAIIVLTVD
jgi:hypothetical protein